MYRETMVTVTTDEDPESIDMAMVAMVTFDV